MIGIFLFSETPFTAVSGNELSAAGKAVDGQTAVVGTAFALSHGRCKFQGIDLFNREHGGLVMFGFMESLSGDQGGAKGTHDTGDIRTDGFTACNFFKASQDGIVIKGSALYDDLMSQFGGIRYLDHLKQCIFNDRVGQTGRDIRHRGPFLLRLFYFGVHENGTTGTKIDWMLGKQSCLCKILYTVI